MTLLVPDDLWLANVPLLPRALPRSRGGRPRAPDPSALPEILFVLRTGTQWHEVPAELAAAARCAGAGSTSDTQPGSELGCTGCCWSG